jgi:hypothetical protein
MILRIRVPPVAAKGGVAVVVPFSEALPGSGGTGSAQDHCGGHRNYNRDEAAFDVGETFSGVDFATGVKAAQEFSGQVTDGVTTAQAALA